MRSIFILTYIFLFLNSFNLIGQQKIVTIKGHEVAEDDLDNFILKQMRKDKLPGLSIAIINDSKIAYKRVFGVQDMSTNQKVNENTLFEAASISKPLFAYFVMKQVENGLLDLDKPLYEYLPYNDISYDERYKLMTTRMVLCHTSGLPNWRKDSLRLGFTPGEGFEYSGEAYDYLKMVLAKIKNTDDIGLDNIFYKEIVVPIGARHMYYTWNNYTAEHKAMGHRKGKTTDKESQPPWKPNIFGSGYSLHTESNDYAKFLIELMNPKVLHKSTVDEMLKSQVNLPAKSGFRSLGWIGWSLGFAIDSTSQGVRYIHTGDNGDFQTYCHFYKDKKMGLVFFCNSDKLYSSKFVRKLLRFLDEETKF
jgi:CubicO group peptidase (beta-lactamase class C family)